MTTSRIAAAGIAALLFASAAPADAQTRVGAKAGINLAEQSLGTDFGSVSADSRTGIVAGGFLHYPLGAPFYLQPEVLYSSKGWSFDDASLKLDYLEIPVLFGAAFPLENSAIRPTVFAGPEIGIQLSCDAEGEDCGDGYKSLDFGLVFGGGVIWGLASFDLFLDGRYALGLTDVLDTGDVVELGDVSAKNRAWQFTAGIGFPVGG